MKQSRWLYWTPRLLSILIVVFLGLLATDAFNRPGRPGDHLAGFVIHLIPGLVVAASAALAWKRELVGGLVFIGLGVLYLMTAGTKVGYAAHLLISLPLVLTGALFVLGRSRG